MLLCPLDAKLLARDLGFVLTLVAEVGSKDQEPAEFAISHERADPDKHYYGDTGREVVKVLG